MNLLWSLSEQITDQAALDSKDRTELQKITEKLREISGHLEENIWRDEVVKKCEELERLLRQKSLL